MSEDGGARSLMDTPPDDFAKQLCLLDFNLFHLLAREELHGVVWLDKEKGRLAPNVVGLTRRFNHVSFWVTREILNAPSAELRVSVLTYFIKLAKKLHQLNNLHSLFAVICGLQSTPIFRLSKMWEALKPKESERYQKLQQLMSKDENFTSVRRHLSSCGLPCLPYLGMYLTDLSYISSAFSGEDRVLKTNQIIDEVFSFKAVAYQFRVDEALRSYLLAHDYVENFRKLIDDQHYQMSLEIQPRVGTVAVGKPDASEARAHPTEFLTMHKRAVKHLGVSGHRKAHSLGSAGLFDMGKFMRKRDDQEGLLSASEATGTTKVPSPLHSRAARPTSEALNSSTVSSVFLAAAAQLSTSSEDPLPPPDFLPQSSSLASETSSSSRSSAHSIKFETPSKARGKPEFSTQSSQHSVSSLDAAPPSTKECTVHRKCSQFGHWHTYKLQRMILKPSALVFLSSKPSSTETELESIDLRGLEVSKTVASQGFALELAVPSGNRVKLRFDTSEERDEWFSSLQSACSGVP
eukprot:m.245673 g.245673  ORF g.245673 m.245673 type:complete len:520 (-) comp54470_c0_seq30:95-1654(-)